MHYYLLNFTGYHPNQKRDSTICRRPKGGPKQEKKHTVMTPSRLKNKQMRMASTKDSPNAELPNTPMAKELETMFAASH